MKKKRLKPHVAVGISGGVDSGVAAYLLKKQGYRVFGVFMVNVDEGQLPGAVCDWEADYQSAKAVADYLDIPLYTWNFIHEYRQEVLKDFFAEYRAGRTPNPDVWCNEKIKFGIFLKRAVQVGADFVATGHYAGRTEDGGRRTQKSEVRNQKSGGYQLLRHRQSDKDQSYFLYRATQQTLAHSLFPLHSMTKPQVRSLAKKIGLPNALRPDSQGICFVGEVKMFDFLKHHLKSKAGFIVDPKGRKLGQHKGAVFYTIGQREGLGLTDGPWYVYAVNVKKNLVCVTNKPQDPRLYTKRFVVENIHWISGIFPSKPVRYTVEVRYHQHQPRQGTVAKVGRNWVVTLDEPERAVTPGQHAVFYQKDVVIGGGVIA